MSPRFAYDASRFASLAMGLIRFVFRPIRGSRFDRAFTMGEIAMAAAPIAASPWIRTGWRWALWLAGFVAVLVGFSFLRLYYQMHTTGPSGARSVVEFRSEPSSIGAADFITGERFQALGDLTIATDAVSGLRSLESDVERVVLPGTASSIDSVPEKELLRIQKSRRPFVYSGLLDDFFEKIYPHLDEPFVLLSHNGDDGVEQRFRPFLDEGKIALWIAQNIGIEHPRLMGVPIGVANHQWVHGNLEALARVQAENPAKTRLCYLQFAVQTNPGPRGRILEIFQRNTSIPLQPIRDYESYLRVLASHRYAICPPGNGVDTHRTWECIYLGVVPVVERSTFTSAFADLPILLVDDWDVVTEDWLEAQVTRISRANQRRARLSYYAGAVAGAERL